MKANEFVTEIFGIGQSQTEKDSAKLNKRRARQAPKIAKKVITILAPEIQKRATIAKSNGQPFQFEEVSKVVGDILDRVLRVELDNSTLAQPVSDLNRMILSNYEKMTRDRGILTKLTQIITIAMQTETNEKGGITTHHADMLKLPGKSDIVYVSLQGAWKEYTQTGAGWEMTRQWVGAKQEEEADNMMDKFMHDNNILRLEPITIRAMSANPDNTLVRITKVRDL